MTSESTPPPTVFISYSHDSPEHADRVLALSDRLRADGIDCILDQYEDSPPEGFPRWMDRQIHAADFVLMICTPAYHRRVMGEEKPGIGHGVTWESTLIYQYIYNEGTKNT
ncbi:MAG TPA: toll/interleukin-1 receptor domain-containing protein, partial [Ktedonobacteraceae bacterium]|nr:toll/interleukin-1 receptor domain-containing protein [Ktedonobacteraceae bacterium]